ncbi:hypothetical protein [Sphingorhabdus sp.]|uniref:hypothetical protein n=1 Tax=Sphingorhabdus sp. TaxID=1902408 RepID=UPI0035941B43
MNNIGVGGPGPRRIPVWRVLGWGSAVVLLLTPLVAMQFTHEVQWTETDFIIAFAIFGIIGALAELNILLTTNLFSRAGGFVAILAGSLVFWSNLGIGMIGNRGNSVNVLFGLVLLIAIVGAWLSILHRNVLPAAMLAAGTVQCAIGLLAGIWGGDVQGGEDVVVDRRPVVRNRGEASGACRLGGRFTLLGQPLGRLFR